MQMTLSLVPAAARRAVARLAAESLSVYSPINVAALFGDQPGRSGAYYGYSWDEILAQNEQALGENLVVGGWGTASSFDNVTTVTSADAFSTVGGSTPSRVAAVLNNSDRTAGPKTFLVQCVVDSLPAVGTAMAYLRTGTNAGGGTTLGNSPSLAIGPNQFLVTTTERDLNLLFVSSASSGANYAISGIKFREIDFTRLVAFEDSAGSVPLVAPLGAGKGCGLLLDRSLGLVRGAEPTLESTMLNGNTYHGDETYTVSQGTAQIRHMYVLSDLVQNSWYEFEVEVISVVGSPALGIDWCDSNTYQAVAVAGGIHRFKLPFRATGYDSTYRFLDVMVTGAGSSARYKIRSIKPLLGNHANQFTAAARGEVCRKFNLRASSEVYTFGYNNTDRAALQPGFVGPDGRLSATRIYNTDPANAAAFHQGTVSVVADKPAIVRLRLKAISTGAWQLGIFFGAGNSTGGVYAHADFNNGVVTTSSLYGSVEDLGSGWYQLTIRYTPTTSAITEVFALPIGKEFLFGGSDTRFAVDEHIGSPYQRVTSPAHYDEEGFPAYLRRQTDDWMKTRINPNGATKVQVWTAVQKLTEAATNMVIEHSPQNDNNAGTFRLVAPSTNGSVQASFKMRGALLPTTDGSIVSAELRSPARMVLSGFGSTLAPRQELRVNGAFADDSVESVSGGAFTEQDTFFGSRAGTSLYANQREFGPPTIIFMQTDDPGLSPLQVGQLDNWYAKGAAMEAPMMLDNDALYLDNDKLTLG
jgi:hypothetical protein